MALRALILASVGVFLAAAAGWGWGDNTSPTQKRPSVEQLIRQLDSDDYETREAATKALRERPDAIPALEKAARDGSVEARRRAADILDDVRTRPARRRVEKLLGRIKNGEVDQFIDQMVAMPELADDTAWKAVMDLAQVIIDKANKEHGTRVRFPKVDGEGWRLRGRVKKLEELDKWFRDFGNRSVNNQRVLVRRIDCDGISESIVVSQGAVRYDARMDDSIVFCNGDIARAGRNEFGGPLINKSIVFCDGSIEMGDCICDSVVIATGSIKADDIFRSVVIATGTVRNTGRTKNSVVIEKCREPLKMLKVFQTLQVGIEVEESREGVVAKKVLGKKPFAAAGVREGDRLLAVGETKIAGAEDFRRAVRRLVVSNKEAVLKVKRGDKAIEIKVKFPD